MQAIQDIQAQVYAVPTEESQADKRISHPIWLCEKCGAVWRCHELSLCPMGECAEGIRFSLSLGQNADLLQAVENLKDTGFSCPLEQLHYAEWQFRRELRKVASWYDLNSRPMIQACYEALDRYGGTHSKVSLALSLLEEDFKYAPDEAKTFGLQKCACSRCSAGTAVGTQTDK